MSNGMAPGTWCQRSMEADLRDAPSIPAIAWSGNVLRQVPRVKTVPFTSTSASLPRAETEQGSSPCGHLHSASMVDA